MVWRKLWRRLCSRSFQRCGSQWLSRRGRKLRCAVMQSSDFRGSTDLAVLMYHTGYSSAVMNHSVADALINSPETLPSRVCFKL